MREIIEEHAGGMREGYTARAMIPGGGSTEFVLPEHFDTPMDVRRHGKAGREPPGHGHGMIVLDDATCPVGAVHNLERFFARESCGWCTPCRDGLPWLAHVLGDIEEGRGRREDLDVLEEHTWLLEDAPCFCALAPGAIEPLAERPCSSSEVISSAT